MRTGSVVLVSVALCGVLALSLAPSVPAPAAAQPAPAPEIKITSPLVQDLVDTKPDTPSQWISATSTLIDLKHAPIARQDVNQLAAANLDEDQRVGNLLHATRHLGAATDQNVGLGHLVG